MKSDSSQLLRSGLYVIATPIGNLSDITRRAVEVLEQADMLVCEDTRVTSKLLAHLGLRVHMVSYNDHNAGQRRPEILQALVEGKRVALVSDAGTPLISDPGYKLVQAVIEQDMYVTALPGASSVTVALCLSGLPTDRFYFAGFLPAKKDAARKEIQQLRNIPATLVLFESARRLSDSLLLLVELLGDRPAAVTRELTKLYEEVKRGTLSELAAFYQHNGNPKGEVVLVIGAPLILQQSDEDIASKLHILLKAHSVKEASSILAEESGRPRKEIYSIALALKASKDGD